MGKQAGLRKFRSWLRDRVTRGVCSPSAAESADRRARGRQSLGDMEFGVGSLMAKCEEDPTAYVELNGPPNPR